MRELGLHSRDHRIGKFRRSGRSAHIPRQMPALGVYPLHATLQFRRGIPFADVRQHQRGRLHQRRGISHAFSGDIGRGPVDGFEDGVTVADVCAGHDAQSAHQAGRQIGRSPGA